MNVVAKEIVEIILDDLTGRSGGDGFWDGIDEDIQEEIKEEWGKLITAKLNEYGLIGVN